MLIFTPSFNIKRSYPMLALVCQIRAVLANAKNWRCSGRFRFGSMACAEDKVVHGLLAASAGLDGGNLFGFERSEIFPAFLAYYRTNSPLAFSASFRSSGRWDRVR